MAAAAASWDDRCAWVAATAAAALGVSVTRVEEAGDAVLDRLCAFLNGGGGAPQSLYVLLATEPVDGGEPSTSTVSVEDPAAPAEAPPAEGAPATDSVPESTKAAPDGAEVGPEPASPEAPEKPGTPPPTLPAPTQQRQPATRQRRNSVTTEHAARQVVKFAADTLPRDALSNPVLYMMRHAHSGALTLADLEAGVLDVGFLGDGPSLLGLEQLLSEVLLPLLAGQGAAAKAGGAPTSADEAGRSELVNSVSKFRSNVTQALQHLHSDVLLAVPEVDVLDAAAAAEDPELITTLESAVAEWTAALSACLSREVDKQPAAGGPLVELEFWRARAAALGALYEQLAAPRCAGQLAALRAGSEDVNLLGAFAGAHGELGRLYEEAADNVKFLTTLERHFKTVGPPGGDIGAVADCLMPMMNAIRMVWVISRHYSDDARMGALLERLGSAIAARAAAEVNLKELFHVPLAEALAQLDGARGVLDGWQKAYLDVRERIETGGRDARWEFDRRRLFERTGYMATICGELRGMVAVVDEFRRFLGPELKAVTGDVRGIDAVTARVAAMVAPIETLPFDVFDRRNAADWTSAAAAFAGEREEIEAAARSFIDTSFKKLRSAEGALELLRGFRAIRAEGAIGKQMQDKVSDVLERFMQEVDAARRQFDERSRAPPATRNAPPVAGAIAWSRALFAPLRRTYARFTAPGDDLLRAEGGQRVARRYAALAKALMAFEKARFAAWVESAEAAASHHLKQPVLARAGGEEGGAAPAAASGAVIVNFSPALAQLIREARYLDRMGFTIPEAALNVALQEAKYRRAAEALRQLLAAHAAAPAALAPADRALLRSRITALDAVLEPGLTRLNWSSLGIMDFVTAAQRAIAEFSSLAGQVAKASASMESVVRAIAASPSALVPEPPRGPDGGLPDAAELADALDRARVATLEELAERYAQLGPLLGKVEEAVAGTNSGRSPALRDYYAHWERAVFGALTAAAVLSLRRLLALTRSDREQPLLRCTASLVGAEVVLSPPPPEVGRLVGRLARALAEVGRPFTRWMDGTCLAAPEQRPRGEDEEPVVFTFASDVSQHAEVVGLLLALSNAAQRTQTQLSRYADGWRRNERLWKEEKGPVLERFVASEPRCAALEERLSKYARMAADLAAAPAERDCGFVRVMAAPLVAAVRDEALAWVAAISRAMGDADRALLGRMQARLAERDALLRTEGLEGLADLTVVLEAIADVRHMGMGFELECVELGERYRTRALYGVPAEEAEAEAAAALPAAYAALRARADEVDYGLWEPKARFAEETQEGVAAFAREAAALLESLRTEGPGQPGPAGLDVRADALAAFNTQVAAARARAEALGAAQRMFGLPLATFAELGEAEAELKRAALLFDLVRAHAAALSSFGDTLWVDLDVRKLSAHAADIEARLAAVAGGLRDLPPLAMFEDAVRAFRDSIPLLESLKSDALRKRHWEQLSAITGQQAEPGSGTFTLSKLFSMQLHRYAQQVADLTLAAGKELVIETELKRLAEAWKDTRFELAKYTSGSGEDRGMVLRSTDDIVTTLEDGNLTLQSMLNSRFVVPFAEEVRGWEARLSLVGETIEVWMQVQRKWMYLESIFVGSDDIRQQLPEEAKRFDGIDKAWRRIMADTARSPNVVEACTADGRLAALSGLAEELEACQKSLSDYLDTKRNAFPRFFFISDEELLSVLGTSDPTSVQEHMLKLFDNCAALKFGRGARQVLGMSSSEGEAFDFRTPVAVEGAVEVWMGAVEAEMRRTLHTIVHEGTFGYAAAARTAWILANLGMTTLVGTAIWWTWETEDVFARVRGGAKSAMKDFSGKLSGQLAELTAMVRGELGGLDRRKVNSLIITDVHARDIIDLFVRDSVLSASEFAWESQLRFSWDRAANDVLIRQCTGQFQYGYEYMGCNGRLVITALTDRCYMTLTTALTYRLGGAPAGPAGTGKTETVKDLAKALALQCVVFNCGEGLDYKAMGSIFAGLVQCGAWGCFDEFNRIDAEVLSVVSSQIKQIQEALKNELTRFQFEGKEIGLNARTGVFITMNPGYAGRTELPDNLKALFRPVTMVVPDLEQICEIMLFSEGFDTAKALAKKMCVLYKLAKEQLSQQHHYDFGLRALKSVLVMAGALKRDAPDLSEALVLMRALRDMNLPKFVADDVPLFLGLIGDLFPGLDCPRVRHAQLADAIEAELADAHLLVMPEPGQQVDKVVQLYETLLTRHTTMVVGRTGGGKSVILDTLRRAQTRLGTATKATVLNPKAQSVAELYGVLDKETRDWTDGLLSNIFREANRPVPGDRAEMRWIVFDGDVDAVWVENMNSVMDDNKLLTLPNGERIRVAPHCKLLFEVADLQYASPATVSRCGMVYVDARNLGHKPYVWRWCNARAESHGAGHAAALRGLFDKYLTPVLAFILDGIDGDSNVQPLARTVPVTGLNMATQLCAQLETVLDAEESKVQLDPSNAVDGGNALEAAFVYCLVWSAGAAVVQTPDRPDRTRLDAFIKRCSGMELTGAPVVAPGLLPEPSLYDYVFLASTLRWVTWTSLVPAFQPTPGAPFHSILVPTPDTVRAATLLGGLLAAGRPVLFVGAPGTAKTVCISRSLAAMDPTRFSSLTLNFSSRTSAADVQRALEGAVEKRTKDTYGPPGGRRLVVFCDDLNMPRMDQYGTQQPLALLRIAMDRRGVYDRGKELSWKHLRDVQYCAAMGPPGGARHVVDPRLVSLFAVFEVPFPGRDALRAIYAALVEGHAATAALAPPVTAAAGKLPAMMLELYTHVCTKLPPTPSRFHYIFNLRDLSRVVEGVCTACVDTVADAPALLRLFRNEALRVFHDRLINEADKAVVLDKLAELVTGVDGPAAAAVCAEPCLFGDFAAALAEGQPRLYQDAGGYAEVQAAFEAIQTAHNERAGTGASVKPVTLVLFEDALEHLVRIHRVLRLERGHALLVGVGGSGKQSLARLAAAAAGCVVFEITLARGYDEAAFREDLKKLYTLVGTEGKRTMFLFTDSHVADEGFLELVNNMLASGMPPGLYAEDEKEPLCSVVRDEVAARGLPETREVLWGAFVERCRANLHVVLAMSPVGDTLRARCRNFPALVNNTVIDWFTPWPLQALNSVADAFLAEVVLPDGVRPAVVAHMCMVHEAVRDASTRYYERLRRHNYVTPKNYLDFVNSYKRSLAAERQRVADQVARLDGGLQKLIQAASEVDKMAATLTEAKKVVDAKSAECAQLLTVIRANTAEVETRQKDALAQETHLEARSVEIAAAKAEAESQLAAAIPALEAAAAALNSLKKDEITEIRSFAKPNITVQKVCECVVILRNLKDVSWGGAKLMMTDNNFLKTLVEYDKDSITAAQMKKLLTYFKDPLFTVEEVVKVSQAAAGLLGWVTAMRKYYDVAANVKPMRDRVAGEERNLREAQQGLKATKAELVRLSDELAKLRAQFEEKSAEERDLAAKAELMERRLRAAEQLMEGLGSERTRWTAELGSLAERRERLVGDCLLAASFLSYAGGFTFDFRAALIYDAFQADLRARAMPLSSPFRLEELLTNDVEKGRWAAEGLPMDELSVQNGILTTRAGRAPLCIDPQQQAVAWIRRREGKALEGRCRGMGDADATKQLELAIQYGFPFLFEGLDEYLDPVIDPVLEKLASGAAAAGGTVKLGDKDVDWDPSFRLYLTSKLPNPHYGPEVAGKCSIINYGVTQDGLRAQLLNVTVRHERPDLEEQREALVAEMAAAQQLLKSLEDTLLRELSAATGNILDNSELISTLESTKSKAVEIAQKLAQARTTAGELEVVRRKYEPVALRGAVLFFVLAGLSALSGMYEYSLAAFLGVFNNTLDTAPKPPTLEARLRAVVEAATYDMYAYACLGLFERHKLSLSFQMCVKIAQADDALDGTLLDFFLKGNLSLERGAGVAPRPGAWWPEQGWHDLQRLVAIGAANSAAAAAAAAAAAPGGAPPQESALARLVEYVGAAPEEWRTWAEAERPESMPLPCGLSAAGVAGLNDFEAMCLLRCVRPDRVTVAVTRYVAAHLGERYTQPPVLDYAEIYRASSPVVPVVFVLSPGADPAFDVFRLGEEMGFKPGGKLKYLSLGQGMGPKAAELLETGASRGLWVMLQNCHLLPSWLRSLEALLDKLGAHPAEGFRLWLTTDPTDAFPLGILQRSLKVVTEPPNGLRQNMRASYAKITQAQLDECPHPAFGPLVFVLAFFHAVAQERRKYGKLGWNVAYDFNETDFRISTLLISTYLGKAAAAGDEVMPWATLRYLIGEAMYGGRVSDSFDRAILATYLDEYLGDFLFDSFQPYAFYRGPDAEVTLPVAGPREVYTAAVEALPALQSPELFGLHVNADISYYTAAAKALWTDVVALQPRAVGGGGGVSREDSVGATVRDILARLPPEPFDLPLLRRRLGVPSPTQIVLLQELERWEALVARMRGTLADLLKALAGEIGMSAELDALETSLFNGRLPAAWARLTPATEKKLGGWMSWLERRYAQYDAWAQHGEPAVMWLSGLHIPETYLAALVQSACRARGWPLDRSTLFTTVTPYADADAVPGRLEYGCYCEGLYLEGAAWSTTDGRLVRQPPRQLVQALPVMQIIPAEAARLKRIGTFSAPVYVTQSRRSAMGTGFVCTVDLATDAHPSHWCLQGVALVLNTDE